MQLLHYENILVQFCISEDSEAACFKCGRLKDLCVYIIFNQDSIQQKLLIGSFFDNTMQYNKIYIMPKTASKLEVLLGSEPCYLL